MDINPDTVAAENWQRYKYGLERGHRDYTESARFLEGYYLGGQYDGSGRLQPGGHWSADDLATLEEQRRPAYELNQILPALNSAFGYQISNRMDISFRPRAGSATRELAESRSKVAMQIASNCKLHWIESDVFQDGMIQQRGYYDVRMDFDDSEYGELLITSLDPLDVIPDPDAKGYDPRTWGDVIVLRWLSLDEIEGIYGIEMRRKAEASASYQGDRDHGEQDDEGAERSKFALTANDFGGSMHGTNDVLRLRVIDRQRWVRDTMTVATFPGGDVRQLAGDEAPEVLEQMRQSGAVISKRRMKRVRWTVSTCDTTLHDDWSPYDRFTVILFSPYFRRGQTRGMVDNAVGPQRIVDKAASQAIQIINSTANGGWQMEQGQLTNMSSRQLQEQGAQTGLVLERKVGSLPLQKIQANAMPPGIEKLIEISSFTLGEVTVPPAMRGVGDGQESGIAIQSKQHASQQQLAVPLDNLARTRNILADWIDYAIGKYYTAERTFRITKTDPNTGKEVEEVLTINQLDPATGAYLNDMTSGEYETVITEQPMQVTFENSQFTQAIEMRDKGIAIPDVAVIRKSNLSDKAEIIEQMQAAQSPKDPLAEAKAVLAQAQARLVDAQTVSERVGSMYSATTSANQIALQPTIAPMADQMLASAGFVDSNAAPVIPQATPGAEGVDAPVNTSPLFPPNPDVGIEAGIESGQLPQGQ